MISLGKPVFVSIIIHFRETKKYLQNPKIHICTALFYYVHLLKVQSAIQTYWLDSQAKIKKLQLLFSNNICDMQANNLKGWVASHIRAMKEFPQHSEPKIIFNSPSVL